MCHKKLEMKIKPEYTKIASHSMKVGSREDREMNNPIIAHIFFIIFLVGIMQVIQILGSPCCVF